MAKTPKSTHARMMEELNRTLQERPKVEPEEITPPRSRGKKKAMPAREDSISKSAVNMEELQSEIAKSMARRHPTSSSAKGRKEKARPKRKDHYDKSVRSIAGGYEGIIKYGRKKKSSQDKLIKFSTQINASYQTLLKKHKGDELKATQALVAEEFPKLLYDHRKSKDFDMYRNYLTIVAQARLDSFLPSTEFPETKVTLDPGLTFDRDKYQSIITELTATERTYNQKLKELRDLLQKLERRDPDNKASYEILKGNLIELITCSDDYLTELEAIDDDATPQQWMTAFLKANSPDALIEYGNGLGEAAQTYEVEKLAVLKQILQSKSGKIAFAAEKTDTVDLQSLMILPVQRAPRLMMLAKEVNKELVEHSNAGPSVKEHCRNIQDLLDGINKANNTKTGNYDAMHTLKVEVATVGAKHGHSESTKPK